MRVRVGFSGAGFSKVGFSRKGFGAAVALAVGLGWLLAVSAGAHGPGGCGPRAGMLGGLEHGIAKLALAPDTLQTVNAAIDQARSQEQTLRAQIESEREKMHALLDETPPPLDQVLAEADAIGSLETQAKKTALQALVTVRQQLTTEQWQELQAQRRERWHGGSRGTSGSGGTGGTGGV